MTLPPLASFQSTPQHVPGELADDLFWLSKLDENLPRSHLVPDFKRNAVEQHSYQGVAFTLDPEVVQVLKSVDKTHGVSDLVLCASLLSVLLAKYDRQDELIIGLQTPASAHSSPAVVPLRIVGEREATALTIIRTIAEENADLLKRSPCAVGRMAQILGVEITRNRCPFFDIALAVGEGVTFDFETYPVDLAFLFDVNGGHIRGRIEYAADLFERSRIERLAAHLVNAAVQVSLRPGVRSADIDILSPHERRRIVNDLSGRRVEFPRNETIHSRFETQVHQTPGAIAAIYRDVSLTYTELNLRANRLAQSLLSLGLGKGQFVGILLNRSCDFLIAMLAVFKAGGAYVPLDPTYPRDRIRYMLDDSEAVFVISNAALVEEFRDVIAGSGQVRSVLCMEGDLDTAALNDNSPSFATIGPDAIARAAGNDPALPHEASDRAYMIYTSGSTGLPKGAICRHNGALNHLYGELEGLKIDYPFSFLQTAAASSDISVWQFVAPLLFGGATVIVDYDVVVDPAQLFTAIRDHRVTVAELVPVVLRGLVDHISDLPHSERSLPDLRFMMATGEALATELVDRWLSYYPDVPIANTYGPTETSDDVTLLVLREPLSDRRPVVPIGRPLPNMFIFILDRDLRPVPVGAPGEICIAGIGVGEGYWRQPEKTAAAFVPAAFPEVSDGTMYRSGDLGRWLTDGSIEFLGRIDQQVKVRGFRVEPGEIEAVLTQHPAILDAAVVAVEDGSGTNRLVGYFVTRKEESVNPGAVRQFLRGTLADHMIPGALVGLSALPLTPLGKVDRKALSRIDYLGQIESENYVAPKDEIEETLAAAWSTVLGQRRISVEDNFFELGGDSISTIYVIAELKKTGIKIAPKQIFLYPTIAALAAQLRSATAASAHAEMNPPPSSRAEPRWDDEAWRKKLDTVYRDLSDVYPLAATQRGIYFQSVLPSRISGAYIEQIAFDLTGDLDEEAFAKAWQHTVNVTEVLRTAVIRRGVPQPMQIVLKSATSLPDVKDWRHLAQAEWSKGLDVLTISDRQKGFDLTTPPLTRMTLVRLDDKRWHVLWTYHHIILDGWSEPLILESVFSAYDAQIKGRLPPPDRSRRYRDFVAWSEAQDQTAAQSFWRQQLAGFVLPVSIKDNSPGIQPPTSGEVSHGWREIMLSDAETGRLEDVARRNKLTFSTIIHGAWGLLLHRRTTSSDVVFGSVASGRQCELPQIETIRGVVVVTQPVRTTVVADATVCSWLRSLQLQMAEIREFEQTPLALIQQWCEVPVEKRPLFDTIVVMANYLGSDLAHCHPKNIELSNVAYFTQPLFALTLFVMGGARASVRVVYDKRRYAAETVRQLLDEYQQLLTSIAENPEQRLGGSLILR